jgi:hypothetical protein
MRAGKKYKLTDPAIPPAIAAAPRLILRFILTTQSTTALSEILNPESGIVNPHFSQAFYSGGVSRHVYCVALCRIPRRTVEYACGILASRWPKRQMRLVSMPVYPASLRKPVRNAG